MITALVVDDQELVRSGFALILDTAPDIEVVGQAADGAAALAAVRELRPDVVLMDLQMPVMDGVEATRHLTSSAMTRDVRVLVLTTFGSDQHVADALVAGASGFLLKDTTAHDLVQAVRVVAAGDALLAPAVTRGLIQRFVAGSTRPVPEVPDLPTLTNRERDVLVAVADGLSNDEIAARLYVSYSTVKTHVSHLLTKLAVRDRAQLVMVAHRAGLVGGH